MKIVKLLIVFIVVFLFSFTTIHYELIDYDFFVETEFLFTFLSVFIGFAITIYTYITSIFDRVKHKIKITYSTETDISNKIQILVNVHSEIRDDINFVIVGLISTIAFALSNTLIERIACDWYYVMEIKHSILLSIFILSIVAIWDLIKVAFIFSDFLAQPDKKKNEEK